jgi:hypothetical protein
MLETLMAIVLVIIVLRMLQGDKTRDLARAAWDYYQGFRVVDGGRAMSMDHAAKAVRFAIQTKHMGVKSMKTQILGTEKNGYVWVIKIKNPQNSS